MESSDDKEDTNDRIESDSETDDEDEKLDRPAAKRQRIQLPEKSINKVMRTMMKSGAANINGLRSREERLSRILGSPRKS